MNKTRLNLEPLEDRFLPSAAVLPTTAIVAPAADEVSAAISALFGAHGAAYQAVTAQAAAFHAQFVAALQNNNAIAATEAQYGEMWAQDALSLLPPEINSGRVFDQNTPL
jgi:PPE-repeat protein